MRNRVVVALVGGVAAATAVAGPASKLSMVQYGEPSIRGAIERKVVIDALPAELTLVACAKTIVRNYARADAKLAVDGDGKITVAPVTGLDDAGDRCLASVLAKLKLGKPRDGKQVEISIAIEFYARVIPTVSLGAATVTGSLDKATIRRYFNRNLAKIADCYESVQVTNKTLHGASKVEFIISPNGNVSSAKASGLHDDTVEDCVSALVKAIEFPKKMAGGETDATYSIEFHPPPSAPSNLDNK